MTKLWSTMNSTSEKASYIFGSVLFLEGRPPKIPTFSGSDYERIKTGPQYILDPSEEFQKSSDTIVVLWWGYSPSTFHHGSRQHPWCPTQKQKNAVFARFGIVFNQMVGAPRISTCGVAKPVKHQESDFRVCVPMYVIVFNRYSDARATYMSTYECL